MSKLLKSACLISLFFCLTFAFAEEITITTYYPSPYGSYRELRSQRIAIGDNYIQTNDYCWDSTCANPIDDDNNSATPSPVDLVVEGSVGIGTTAPHYPLHVGGTAYVGGWNSTDVYNHFGLVVNSNSQSIPPTPTASTIADDSTGGFVISQNYTGGEAEVDFWNAVVPGVTPSTPSIAKAGFRFLQKTGTNPAKDLMWIEGNSGNVGIGTTMPATTLDVNGSVTLEQGTSGAVLCLTAAKVIGHCSAAASCTATCTCTCIPN